MIIDVIKLLFAGMGVGFQAFLSALSVYQQMSDLKTSIIAIALGVSPIVITLIALTIKAMKFIGRRL